MTRYIIQAAGLPVEEAPQDRPFFFLAQPVLAQWEPYAPVAAKRMGTPGRFVTVDPVNGEKKPLPFQPESWIEAVTAETIEPLQNELYNLQPDLQRKKSMPPEQLKEMWSLVKQLAAAEHRDFDGLQATAQGIINAVQSSTSKGA